MTDIPLFTNPAKAIDVSTALKVADRDATYRSRSPRKTEIIIAINGLNNYFKNYCRPTRQLQRENAVELVNELEG
ncbi:hypothetical protein ACYPKM_02885 [Pseudomonas aeruginosa]